MARQKVLTDREGVRLAEWWAEPLSEGRSPSYTELPERAQRELGTAITQKTAERYVKRAFKLKHVQVRRNTIVPEYQRRKDIERSLKSKWSDSGVKSFVVVESLEQGSESDSVHAQLGYALTDEIERMVGIDFFPEGSRIGIGSGRAIRAVVEGFRRFDPTTTKDIKLISLTGSLYPHYERSDSSTTKGSSAVDDDSKVIVDDSNVIVDADSNVQEFLRYFRSSVEVSLMSSQFATSNFEEEREKRWLRIAKDLYDASGEPILTVDLSDSPDMPTHAFVGIGVFDEDHRLYKCLRDREEDVDTYFAPIKVSLRELFQTTKSTFEEYGYIPIGDICNRFFVVNAPSDIREHSKIKKLTENLEELVNKEINPKLMTVPKTLLRQVPNNILIAGTEAKSHAVRTMLERNYVNFKIVCVDIELAHSLAKP